MLSGVSALDASKGGNNEAFYTDTSQITPNHCLTGSIQCLPAFPDPSEPLFVPSRMPWEAGTGLSDPPQTGKIPPELSWALDVSCSAHPVLAQQNLYGGVELWHPQC